MQAAAALIWCLLKSAKIRRKISRINYNPGLVYSAHILKRSTGGTFLLIFFLYEASTFRGTDRHWAISIGSDLVGHDIMYIATQYEYTRLTRIYSKIREYIELPALITTSTYIGR